MAHVDGTGKRFAPSSKKYDRTIEDALQTMERFAAWLDDAAKNNVWEDMNDPLQMAVLHGMLAHLRDQCGALIDIAGPEVLDTISRFHALAHTEPEAE